MKAVNRFRIFVFTIFLIGLLPMSFASAQNSVSGQDIQAIINQLREQIEFLKTQVLLLQSDLEVSRTELETVKKEFLFTEGLHRGVRGDDVKKLQEVLSKFSDIYPDGTVSGIFGPLTEAAVRKFQEKEGLAPIGIVGPKTAAKLNEFITNGPSLSTLAPADLSFVNEIARHLQSDTSPALRSLPTETSSATVFPLFPPLPPTSPSTFNAPPFSSLAASSSTSTAVATSFPPVSIPPLPSAAPPAPQCFAGILSQVLGFEDDPYVGSNITWNPDYGTPDAYNSNLLALHKSWLNGKGIDMTASPNGFVWSTKISGSAGRTGVVIGFASPNHLEQDEGLSDNEVLTVRFLSGPVKSAGVDLVIINTGETRVNLKAYDVSDVLITQNSVSFSAPYLPVKVEAVSANLGIAKITLETSGVARGGVWIEDVFFGLACGGGLPFQSATTTASTTPPAPPPPPPLTATTTASSTPSASGGSSGGGSNGFPSPPPSPPQPTPSPFPPSGTSTPPAPSPSPPPSPTAATPNVSLSAPTMDIFKWGSNINSCRNNLLATFTYQRTSNSQSFNVYLQYPNYPTFTKYTYQIPAQDNVLVSGPDNTSLNGSVLNAGQTSWQWSIGTQVADSFTSGTYRFYVTVTGTDGSEGPASSVLTNILNAGPTITSPGASVSQLPFNISLSNIISGLYYNYFVFEEGGGQKYESRYTSQTAVSVGSANLVIGKSYQVYVDVFDNPYGAFSTTKQKCAFSSFNFISPPPPPPPSSSTAVTGVCNVRNSYTSAPGFFSPDLGTGYAKVSKPGINTIAELRAACTQADYDALMQSYCTINSASIYAEVIVYSDAGSVQSTGGATSLANNVLSCSSGSLTPLPEQHLAQILQSLHSLLELLTKLANFLQ